MTTPPMDFHGQNLRRRDFSGESLVGADFSDADIRGVDFSDADLNGAQFSRSRGGIPPLWVAAFVGATLLIAALVGILAALATTSMTQRVATGDSAERLSVLVIAAIGIATVAVAVVRSLRHALLFGTIALVSVMAVALPFLAIRGDFSPRAMTTSAIWLAAIVGAFIVGAIARATAGIVSPNAFLIVALVGSIAARTAGGALFAILISVAAVVLARRALANPDEVQLLHQGSHQYILSKATSYRRANLTNAVFTDAATGPSYFTDAIITGATFEGASITGREKVTPERLLEAPSNDNESP